MSNMTGQKGRISSAIRDVGEQTVGNAWQNFEEVEMQLLRRMEDIQHTYKIPTNLNI